MSGAPVLWAHVGPTRHGVHRFGVVLGSAARTAGRARQVRVPDPGSEGAPGRLAAAVAAHRPAAVVLQFTDRLWGADPGAAADAFVRAAGAVGADRRRPTVAVVLHDVPHDPDEGRAAAYARVAAAASVVLVCSDHERRRLESIGVGGASVVPHFVERRRTGTPPPTGRPDVAVLGFLYPGKGHDAVVDAAARSPRRPPVVVLGGPAPGHEDLVAALSARAASSGVPVRTTGWLSDRALHARAAVAGVPVVANCEPSASGSLASWLSVGRRPLVRDSAYAREMAARAPGCLELYPGDDPDVLAARIDAATRRPSSTRVAAVPSSLAPSAVARRVHALLGVDR